MRPPVVAGPREELPAPLLGSRDRRRTVEGGHRLRGQEPRLERGVAGEACVFGHPRGRVFHGAPPARGEVHLGEQPPGARETFVRLQRFELRHHPRDLILDDRLRRLGIHRVAKPEVSESRGDLEGAVPARGGLLLGLPQELVREGEVADLDQGVARLQEQPWTLRVAGRKESLGPIEEVRGGRHVASRQRPTTGRGEVLRPSPTVSRVRSSLPPSSVKIRYACSR